jgi:anti-sigma-K factor RskA
MTDERERECGGDVAAYALGSLDDAETEAFRRHLDECVVCRDELTSFQEVVDVLPMSAPPYQASPALRRRVMRAVAEEARGPARGGARTPRRGRLSFSRPALALGGSFALAVAAAIVVLVLSSSSSPSARVIAAQVTGQGSASLRVSKGHAELVVHRFAAPPNGQIYEVWLQRGGVAHPTKALFGVNEQGDADVDVPGNLHGVSRVMVTREPAGGSQKPTHPPVISATLE